MKHIYIIIILSLFVVSCRNVQDKVNINQDGQLVLHFEAQSTATFFSDRIFGKTEMIPLETLDDCLVGREPVVLLLDQYHYFIQDSQQQIVFRFDRKGKFINRIGSRGMGPEEYARIYDVEIDPVANVVEILAPRGLMMRYGYDGKYLSKQNFDASRLSFIKTGTNYWLFTPNQKAGDKCLTKISEDGTVISTFLPSKTDWMPFLEKNFERCGDMITFREIFSHTVYRITDEGPTESTMIDFGKYTIPEHVYKMPQMDTLNEMEKNDYAMIHKYLENEQFVYLFFYIIPAGLPDNKYGHWLVNKKNGNSVVQIFSPDNPLYDMDGANSLTVDGAKILTADNKLIFMANAHILNDPFFSNATSIKDSLSEDANPVIVSLQINDF